MHLRDYTEFRCRRCMMLTLEEEGGHEAEMGLCGECIDQLRDGDSTRPTMLQGSQPGKWRDTTAGDAAGRRSES